jgi:hypothetical protein
MYITYQLNIYTIKTENGMEIDVSTHTNQISILY